MVHMVMVFMDVGVTIKCSVCIVEADVSCGIGEQCGRQTGVQTFRNKCVWVEQTELVEQACTE